MTLKVDCEKKKHAFRQDDFVQWGFCIAEALGGLGQQFLDDLDSAVKEQIDDLIENNTLATALFSCMEIHGPAWESTVQVAYSILKEEAAHGEHGKDLLKDPTFPHKPQDLKQHLSRLRPVLDEWGITYRYGKRTSKGRPLSFFKATPAEPPETSPAAPDMADEWTAADFEEFEP